MRILIIIHQFFPEFSGGTERVAFNLARMAQRAGHHVRLLACAVEPEKYAELRVNALLSDNQISTASAIDGAFDSVVQGLPITLIPRSRLPAGADISLESNETLVQQLTEWIRCQNFDLAHAMHTLRMGSALQAIQRCGLPYVLTLTDFFLPCARINLVNLEGQSCPGPDRGRRCINDCAVPAWTPAAYLGRFAHALAVLQGASARIAPSDYVAQRYRDSFENLDFQVIAHGVDLLALNAGAAPHAEPLADKPVTSQTPLRMIFIGSIVPQKGLEVLLKAIALLPANAPVTLTVVGGFYGNPANHREIQRLAEADSRITLKGSLPPADVFSLLGRSDLLCLPSLVPESFSLVLHESAAAGVPALVSDLGAPPQQVLRYGCGGVVPAGDAPSWAAAIAHVLAAPEQLQQWKRKLFLPLRIEEEAFFYESVWRRLCRQAVAA